MLTEVVVLVNEVGSLFDALLLGAQVEGAELVELVVIRAARALEMGILLGVSFAVLDVLDTAHFRIASPLPL